MAGGDSLVGGGRCCVVNTQVLRSGPLADACPTVLTGQREDPAPGRGTVSLNLVSAQSRCPLVPPAAHWGRDSLSHPGLCPADLRAQAGARLGAPGPAEPQLQLLPPSPWGRPHRPGLQCRQTS